MKLSFGYMTFPTKQEAREVVLGLLEKELIACANILDGAESYFWWDEDIQKANEVVVIFKTREKNESAIAKFVTKHNSYDVPCVVFTPIVAGQTDFMKWIDETC